MKRALLDMVYRDDPSLAPEGDKDLAHHLFALDGADGAVPSVNYAAWHAVAQHAGLGITDRAAWASLSALRSAIDGAAEDAARWDHIAAFNRELRHALAGGPRLDEAAQRAALGDKMGALAKLVALSEGDVVEVLRIQRSSFLWAERVRGIAREMGSRRCGVWGVSELDRAADLTKNLNDFARESGQQLRVAVFKHRKTVAMDDGVALYVDEARYRVLSTAFVRFSGAAHVAGLPLRAVHFACSVDESGVVTPESLEDHTFHALSAPSEDSAALESVSAGGCLGYAFTERLSVQEGRWFDERVAVFAVIERRDDAVGGRVLVGATHLWHTQNRPSTERLRLEEARQLCSALEHYEGVAAAAFGKIDGTVLLGDLNDAPSLAWFGRGEEETPVYAHLTREARFVDAMLEGRDPASLERAPTTVTLERAVPIDHILLRGEIDARPDKVQPVCLAARDEAGALVLLPEGVREGAVTGTPMPPCGAQRIVPSDHVPVSATVRLRAAGP